MLGLGLAALTYLCFVLSHFQLIDTHGFSFTPSALSTLNLVLLHGIRAGRFCFIHPYQAVAIYIGAALFLQQAAAILLASARHIQD